jgi:hypothetical protein
MTLPWRKSLTCATGYFKAAAMPGIRPRIQWMKMVVTT